MGIKVYLDDKREAPEGWVQVDTATAAINLLECNQVDEISLDHDLGDEAQNGTGYDVLVWIEEQVRLFAYKPPRIHIHTANPVARRKMELGLASVLHHSMK